MYINQRVRGAVRRYPRAPKPMLSGLGAFGDDTEAFYDASGALQCSGPVGWNNCTLKPGWTKKVVSSTLAPATLTEANAQGGGALNLLGKLFGGALTGSANMAAMSAAQQQAYLQSQQSSSTTTYLLLGALGVGALYLLMGD